jgi:hypothetical protein
MMNYLALLVPEERIQHEYAGIYIHGTGNSDTALVFTSIVVDRSEVETT